MTKVIILGEKEEKTNKKPIEFVSYVGNIKDKVSIVEDLADDDVPSTYDNIELVCKNYINKMDLMFAFFDTGTRSNGLLYLGYFNDGVVE